MYKCKDCMNFVHNPQFWGNDNGKCEKDEEQHGENQDCCSDFKERETGKSHDRIPTVNNSMVGIILRKI